MPEDEVHPKLEPSKDTFQRTQDEVEKSTTPLEALLWIDVAVPVEEVLKMYNHTPSYRQDFLDFLQDKEWRENLIKDIHSLWQDSNAIQQTILEYVAESCPELRMYNSVNHSLETRIGTDNQLITENQQKTAIKEEQEFLKTVKEKGVWRIKDNDLAMQNAKDMIEIYKKRWYVLQTLEARKAFVDLGLSVEGLQTKK